MIADRPLCRQLEECRRLILRPDSQLAWLVITPNVEIQIKTTALRVMGPGGAIISEEVVARAVRGSGSPLCLCCDVRELVFRAASRKKPGTSLFVCRDKIKSPLNYGCSALRVCLLAAERRFGRAVRTSAQSFTKTGPPMRVHGWFKSRSYHRRGTECPLDFYLRRRHQTEIWSGGNCI